VCLKTAPNSSKDGTTASKGVNDVTTKPLSPTTQPEEIEDPVEFMKPKFVRYSKWSPMANAIFNELTLAVVAGTHFTDDSDNNPSITGISCPVDQLGNLDFSKANAAVLTCDATGTSLDKAKTVKLRNAQNAADAKTADGTVSTSGDAGKAAVKLELSQLGVLEAATYKVWTTSSAGTENGGTPIIHLTTEPFVTDDPSRAALDLDQILAAGASATTVLLKGYHLDKIKSVHLGSQEDKISSSDVISIDASLKGLPTATSASFEITPAQAAKLPPGTYTKDQELKMFIFITTNDKPSLTITTGQTLIATGTVKPTTTQEKAESKPIKKKAPGTVPPPSKKKIGTSD
jgi:hypothetical protein